MMSYNSIFSRFCQEDLMSSKSIVVILNTLRQVLSSSFREPHE
jgi:hypothetical protein